MNKVKFAEYAERILIYLKDEDWIIIKEINTVTRLPEETNISILEFMEYSKFIDFDKKRKTIKIRKLGKELLEIPLENHDS